MSILLNPNMDDAPKDKPLLLNIGAPPLVMGAWCPDAKAWAWASPYCDGSQTWFENDIEGTPLGWAPWPDIQ